MKTKRVKHVRKALTFYRNYFDIKPPYEVLVDGTFCKAALTNKINILDQTPKYLKAEVKLQTTKCVLAECEAFGTLLYGPLKILQQYEVVECGHEDNPPAAVCLARIARKQKKHPIKYFIATQDQKLSESIRKSAGVPLLYLSQKTLVLESPSDKTRRQASTLEHDKILPTDHHFHTLEKLKTEAFGPQETVVKKKRKKIKGPNPLSCKKKKKPVQPSQSSASNQSDGDTKVKKCRKRKRKNHNPVQNTV